MIKIFFHQKIQIAQCVTLQKLRQKNPITDFGNILHNNIKISL